MDSRGLGTLPVEPPLQGAWTFAGTPASVSLLGTTFNLAGWAWPLYSGVVAQYRQAVPYDSMHLFVLRDGSYVVDHVDEVNPDLASPVDHALLDFPWQASAAAGLFSLAAGFVGGMFAWRRK